MTQYALHAKAKLLGFKKRLYALGRRNDPIPVFVRTFSRGKIQATHGTRSWRRQKLRI